MGGLVQGKYLVPRGIEEINVRGENSQCGEARLQGALLQCIKERGSGWGLPEPPYFREYGSSTYPASITPKEVELMVADSLNKEE